MTELSDDEKQRLAKEALTHIEPIAQKYELDTQSGRAALYEAFQAGIRFAIGETKKLEEEQNNG